jgi:hypothetical protein
MRVTARHGRNEKERSGEKRFHHRVHRGPRELGGQTQGPGVSRRSGEWRSRALGLKRPGSKSEPGAPGRAEWNTGNGNLSHKQKRLELNHFLRG